MFLQKGVKLLANCITSQKYPYSSLYALFVVTDICEADTFIIIIIIITGRTALCEPWPPSGFLNNLIFMV
jgi:hypothetical protein